jgi:hypothetical protein
MAGLIPIGRIVDPSKDIFPSTGAHLDVRVIPQFGASKGKKIDPRSAKSLLQNILVGKDKRPLVQQQGDNWTWNLPVTSEFGPREAPTAGASTFHQGIDIGVPVGTELTYKGYGTYRPDRGFGSLMTADAQGNPYEIRLLHTEPGKAASVGSSVVPAASQLPSATAAQANEKNTDQLMASLVGEQPSLKDMLLAGALQKAMQRKQETMNQFMQPIQSAAITPQQAMELFS